MATDAILIPGGGLLGAKKIPPWVKERLEKAAEIFTGKEFVIALSRGTTHKAPPMDHSGFPVDEATASAVYLKKKGIPKKRILTENVSLDTIGNAFFARAIHTEQRNFRNLLIITSQFHMERTKAIFNWVFSLSPTKTKYCLEFIQTPNTGLSEKILAARKKKEKESQKKLLKIIKKIHSMETLHKWLFSEHQAYSAGQCAKKTTGKEKETY